MAKKQTLQKSVQYRVAKGIEFLNKEYGRSWLRRIDPERLALESCSACMLGQLEGDYDEAVQRFALVQGKAAKLGFNVARDWKGYDDDYEDETMEFNELTVTWRDKIQKLRDRFGVV